MTTIYGVDSTKPMTPLKVRDALVECFFQAHCENTELSDERQSTAIKREYCLNTVQNVFKKTGGDFDQPTKDSLIKAMQSLAEFSATFRNQAVIKKHFSEMMKLTNLLP